MQFEDLQEFLQVRPGMGIVEAGDDRVLTPFEMPGSGKPISVSVRRIGMRYLVHDNGEAAASQPLFDEVIHSPVFEAVRKAWIDAGIQVDEEKRIFTFAHDREARPQAVARVIEAQIVVGALAAALGSHGSHCGACPR